ncbi:MAG TPA: LytTR family transcriptional regulator DNA-binding domain-containing protein [Bryobacteraceae bacterium]|jgi:two-component system response regulator LytT|nr:LytTR family transcriptional regulator DNA-binding domain-containing protein [Bryobacteraceae bacterium]
MVNRATSVSSSAPNNAAAKPASGPGSGPLVVSPAPTISAVLVDDEKLASDELAYLLKEFADVEVIATAANGLEAVKLIADLEPDLVFLDVQMPGLDGMGVIEKLRAQSVPLPYFVMATAYDQYAVEAFRLQALDYLLKPVEKDRLAVAVERARKGIAERAKAASAASPVDSPPAKPSLQRSKLLVKSNHRNFIVDAQDVVYATIDDGLITVVAANLEGQSNYRTIEELQSNLDPDMFWRVHRSYLVNIHRIKEVIPWFKSSFQLRMDDKKQTEIPVSRVQTKRLRALLKL